MLIREVILENFMSYEYARIPFKPGVNVICGPNGAGKSSILLGISVALGQSYTERSKKLSDLIRWGKDQARVTLVLDNSRRGKRRPIPKFNKDQIFLTRILRRDGKYWFELENRAATRQEVRRLLSRLGVDPDNMLVIMHQNMVEIFTLLSPQEKLRMVEAAVGFESYRRNVLDAQKKLSRVLSQEESVSKLLESAEQTLNYWREQYDRYQQKKQLIMKRRFLERELAWAEVAKREKNVEKLREQIRKRQGEIDKIQGEIQIINERMVQVQDRLSRLRGEWQKLIEERLALERERAKQEYALSTANQTLKENRSWMSLHQETIQDCLRKIKSLETILKQNREQTNMEDQLTEIKKAHKQLETLWSQRLNLKNENLKETIESSTKRLKALNSLISDAQEKMSHARLQMEKASEDFTNQKIRLAILQYQSESLTKAIGSLNQELRAVLTEVDAAREKAEKTGPRIVSVKTVEEILDEIRLTDGHIAALADVSEDIERMYESYSKLYLQLKEKAQQVAENREKALEEVKLRMEAWRKVIKNLLEHVNLQYQAILSHAQAVGEVRLINQHDIEAAGLEILVGFKGAKPVPLDAYTQSGGERSTATMTFLLALQQHVRSPFRAVDEYDIHMDPRNREIIAKLLVSSVSGVDAQYLAITPSQISFTQENVHVITVQNVEGTSIIKELTSSK
jgi:chromosome segregation protein